MSTTFKEINGKVEAPIYQVVPKGQFPKVEYQDVTLSLTSFWGGAERGRSLQLTISNGNYIQLTKEAVQELRDSILDWLEGKQLEEI
jgi:hypothetical protein